MTEETGTEEGAVDEAAEEVIEEPGQEDTQDGAPEAEGDEGDEGEETEATEYEFDFGGKALTVPKEGITPELAEEVQRFSKGIWSDYTQKSQAVAETVKSLEARESAIQKLGNLQGETLDTYSKGLALRAELDGLSKIDVNAMWQSDPDQARRVSDAIAGKKAEFESIVARVSDMERAHGQMQAAETARRAEEGKQAIERRVKGFSAKANEVVDYVVKTYGIPKQEAETWPLNPAAAEMAYKAWQFDQLQAKTKKKTSAPEKVNVSPTKPIRGRSTKGIKDPDKMSSKEWLKWRNAQLNKKGAG